MTAALPRVLCVDDDARLLEGLTPHLRRDYQFHTAVGGEQALKILSEIGGFAVVVSDMRMPGMDGAAFLSRVAQLHPTTTRILLTGEPGRDGAVRAVNEGQIYRFLTKPCPPPDLKAAINAGIKQHELVNAERVLLQETLLGSIRALTDVLALAHPQAFGRAGRVKQMSLDLAERSGHKQFWQLEAAALLSQLGFISLPAELTEKFYGGAKLTPDEQQKVREVPQVARRVLGHLPRIDTVLQILDGVTLPPQEQTKLAPEAALGARILSLVLDYDTLSSQGQNREAVIDALHRGHHDRTLLDLLGGADIGGGNTRELPLREVKLGMVLVSELRNERGALLVAPGFEVSAGFLERMHNLGGAVLNELVRVKLPAQPKVTSD